MTRNSDISDTDRELFRRSVGNVRKIRQIHIPVRKPRPVPAPAQTDICAQPSSDLPAPVPNVHAPAGAELLFKRPGMQDRVVEKLRKGKFSIQRELDLHGLNSTDAQAALRRFLVHCRQHHIRCIRIIHGKGRGSMEGRPIIKNKLNQWLREISQVIAFCPARACDGGSGAVYVLLKN